MSATAGRCVFCVPGLFGPTTNALRDRFLKRPSQRFFNAPWVSSPIHLATVRGHLVAPKIISNHPAGGLDCAGNTVRWVQRQPGPADFPFHCRQRISGFKLSNLGLKYFPCSPLGPDSGSDNRATSRSDNVRRGRQNGRIARSLQSLFPTQTLSQPCRVLLLLGCPSSPKPALLSHLGLRIVTRPNGNTALVKSRKVTSFYVTTPWKRF